MKKLSIISYVLAAIILGVLGAWVGAYIYKINNLPTIEMPILEGRLDEELEGELALVVNQEPNKISPKCILEKEIHFRDCNHTEYDEITIPQKYVNMTEKEFRENYKGKVLKFEKEKIRVYEEVEKNCGNHYKVTSNNGYIEVFKINSDNTEKIYKETNIAIKYLTEMDKRMLEDGIKVLGEEGVNGILEDYK